MKVIITRSQKYIEAQRLATGLNVPESISVEISPTQLSEKCRAVLLAAGAKYGVKQYPEEISSLTFNRAYEISGSSWYGREHLTADIEPEQATPEVVEQVILAAAQAVEERREKEVAWAVKAVEIRGGGVSRPQIWAPEEFRNHPAVQARIAELQPALEEAIRAYEREQAERDAERARAEAEHKQGFARLREWALQHGSETLRLRIELGVGEWEKLARQEYVDAHLPTAGGVQLTRQCWIDTPRGTERRTPTAEELRALKELLELAAVEGSLIRDPRLLWCVEQEETDEDGETIPARRYAQLACEVVCPDGATITVARIF